MLSALRCGNPASCISSKILFAGLPTLRASSFTVLSVMFYSELNLKKLLLKSRNFSMCKLVNMYKNNLLLIYGQLHILFRQNLLDPLLHLNEDDFLWE